MSDINAELDKIAQNLVSAAEIKEGPGEAEPPATPLGTEELEELAADDEETVIADEVIAETEDEELEYFNQLPDAIGLSSEDFYGLKLKLDNGETLSLSEMKDHLQTEKSRLEQIQQQETALREREAELTKVQNEAPAMTAEIQKAQGQLFAIESAWNGLQQQQQIAEQNGDTDALTRVNTDMLKLQQMYTQTQGALQQEQQKAQAAQQEQISKLVQNQQQALLKAVPSWNKDTTVKTMGYLTDSLGLTQAEMKQAYDHRFWVIADKARQWDEHTNKVTKVRQKVKKGQLKAVPGRKGRPVTQTAKQNDELDKAINAASKDPRKINDALDALAKGLINGNV